MGVQPPCWVENGTSFPEKSLRTQEAPREQEPGAWVVAVGMEGFVGRPGAEGVEFCKVSGLHRQERSEEGSRVSRCHCPWNLVGHSPTFPKGQSPFPPLERLSILFQKPLLHPFLCALDLTLKALDTGLKLHV